MSINSFNLENTLFRIICLSYGVVIVTAMAEPLYYPNVTTKDCGIGYEPEMVDDKCFEWNKDSHDEHSPFQNIKPADENEVPFVVPVFVWRNLSRPGNYKEYNYCLGTVINEQWVITSPDCYEGYCKKKLGCLSVEYVIYPGIKDFNVAITAPKDYRTTKAFNLKYNFWSQKLYALKFDKRIPLNNQAIVNSVCLNNNKGFFDIEGYERALIVGFGYKRVNNDYTQIMPNYIHVGWVKVTLVESHRQLYDIAVAPHLKIGGGEGCIAATGSPVVQYIKGKAVLIGINAGGTTEQETKGKCFTEHLQDNVRYANFTKFTKYISNLKEVIKKNP